MTDPNSERIGKPVRENIRVEVQLELNMKLAGDDSGAVYHAVTKNISLGGLCIQVYDRKEELLGKVGDGLPEMLISLYFIDDDRSFDIRTRTAWISSRLGWVFRPSDDKAPLLLGMAFQDLKPGDEERINTFIVDTITGNRESVIAQEKRILEKIFRKNSP